MQLVKELKRRNVFQVAATYLVVGWLLTEVLSATLPALGAPQWTVRAVILTFAFGFIPAVVVSWFYEMTPEGIIRDHDPGEGEVPRQPIRKRDYVTVTVVFLAVVAAALVTAHHTTSPEAPAVATADIASVAVLPFENLSNDDDNEYFSDGLTETLLHMLSEIPNLKVAGRTSSFAFRNQNKSIQEIAAALGVANVLEGSVQRSGDRVRVTAQLVRASDGFQLWSESFDRTLDDIFRIQDEIAEKVGFALSQSLLGDAAATKLTGVDTENSDAYDLFLMARKERVKYSFGGLKAAEDLLKGALLIDPGFLDAKTELATVYLHEVDTGLMDKGAGYPEIVAITDQVLAANPDDAVARATHLFTQASMEADAGDQRALRGAATELQRLVKEAPDELQVRMLLVRALQRTDQVADALPVLEEALSRDRFNPRIHFELGLTYLGLERWDEAQAALEKSLDIEPAQPNAYTNLAVISLHRGDGVEFVQKFLQAIKVDPRDQELPGMLAAFLYELGLVEEADDFRARVMAIAPRSSIAYRLELLRALAVGDDEQAVASARHAIADGIDDRQFAFTSAVQQVLRDAVRRGTVSEATDYLESVAPGILDVDAASAPPKYRHVQQIALDAWVATLPRDEVLRRLDRVIRNSEIAGMDPARDPFAAVAILAVRGEVKQAVDVALNRLFSQSVAANLGWQRKLAESEYAQVVEDPKIQAAMQRWQDEETKLRGEVRAYLADVQAESQTRRS
jgi:TolB-like protein/Flp pilus assembly protein TadD